MPAPADLPAGHRFSFSMLALFVVVASAGCVSGAWRGALEEDTPAAYYRFVREHPGSRYEDAAQEHFAFHKLKRKPTLEAFASFEKRYPNSRLAVQLRDQLAEASFAAARAVGTPDAYDAFARDFPQAQQASRARANALYLRDRLEASTPERLREFAQTHPESDFAAEALRIAEVATLRLSHPIRRVALVVSVPQEAPEARRVAQAFAERAIEQYGHAGVALHAVSSAQAAASKGYDAVLEIRHREEAIESGVSEGLLARPGVRATTRVQLQLTHPGEASPLVWEREFVLNVESREHVDGTSVLFGSAAPLFWDDFFLPLATWPSRAAVREPVTLSRAPIRLAAVDARADRAVAMLENGDLRVLQLADPASPVVLARYEQPNDLERFGGVKLVGSQIAIYGEDGLEVLAAGEQGLRPVAAWSRGEVGSVFAIVPDADALLLGTNKGLLRLSESGREVERLLRRAVLAVDRSGSLLVIGDEDTILLSSVANLREKRLLGRLRVGKDFATRRVRVYGRIAFVVGDGGVIVLDVGDPREPRIRARLLPERVGRVADVQRVGGRIFLIGDRGVQVLSERLDRVAEVVQTVEGRGAAPLGRHLVVVGNDELQVVDALAFDRPKRSSGTARPAGR